MVTAMSWWENRYKCLAEKLKLQDSNFDNCGWKINWNIRILRGYVDHSFLHTPKGDTATLGFIWIKVIAVFVAAFTSELYWLTLEGSYLCVSHDKNDLYINIYMSLAFEAFNFI